MVSKLFLVFISFLVLTSLCLSSTPTLAATSDIVIDMVHNNPGETPFNSSFNDPNKLKSWGYNGQVKNDFAGLGCAVTYDTFDTTIFPAGSAERNWVLAKAQQYDAEIQAMHNAGLKAYYFMDVIVFPKSLVTKYQSEICNSSGKIDISKTKTQQIFRILLQEILARFPAVDGLVIRTGEVYTQNIPYHQGNNPILSQDAAGENSHKTIINILRDEFCVNANKKVIYRTWDFGWFHTNTTVYQNITNAITPHANLIFSVKHTQGDYHRTIVWNPTIGIGNHQQVVEVQCQREYEGKGAYSSYIGKGVIDGFEEYQYLMPSGSTKCLNDIKTNSKIVGVFTWSRGGGWRGPYISEEIWCELNAYVLSKWAQANSRTELDLCNEFATNVLGLTGNDVASFRQIALLSADAQLREKECTHGGIDVWWYRDDNFDKTPPINQRSYHDALFRTEKTDAVNLWAQIVNYANTLQTTNTDLKNAMVVTAKYGSIKAEIVEKAVNILTNGEDGDSTGVYNWTVIKPLIDRYDQLWADWNTLKNTVPECATLFTAGAVGTMVEKYRALYNSSQVLVKAEAENALISGAVIGNSNPGYSGTGYVDYVNATGDYIQWTVNVATAGTSYLDFRYANGGGADRPLKLEVNGNVVNTSLPFPPTGGWGTWSTVTVSTGLNAGNNTVKLTAIGSSGGNIDYLAIRQQQSNLINSNTYTTNNGWSNVTRLWDGKTAFGQTDSEATCSGQEGWVEFNFGADMNTLKFRFLEDNNGTYQATDWKVQRWSASQSAWVDVMAYQPSNTTSWQEYTPDASVATTKVRLYVRNANTGGKAAAVEFECYGSVK
jgi:hypothetical protein